MYQKKVYEAQRAISGGNDAATADAEKWLTTLVTLAVDAQRYVSLNMLVAGSRCCVSGWLVCGWGGQTIKMEMVCWLVLPVLHALLCFVGVCLETMAVGRGRDSEECPFALLLA